MSDSSSAPAPDRRMWWKYLNRYHWYVFALCAMGWLFDTMDQKIFTITRDYALRTFLPDASSVEIVNAGAIVTSIFILGWATGGLVFGILGDKWGRAKTMAFTIMIYALFTGLSAVSWNWQSFAICRFLTGMGVGGEFAAGASLLAEVIPTPARADSLGMLQALSAVGNVLGAGSLAFVAPTHGNWKYLYLIGTAPALLAVFVRIGLKEPDKWLEVKANAVAARARGENIKMGGLRELFAHPRWRRNALAGMGIAIAGQICLWGIGFYSPELIHSRYPNAPARFADTVRSIVLEKVGAKQMSSIQMLNADVVKLNAEVAALNSDPTKWTDDDRKISTTKYELSLFERKILGAQAKPDGTVTAPLPEALVKEMKIVVVNKSNLIYWGEIIYQIGAFLGMLCFSYIAARIGRRLTFLAAFIIAWSSVIYVYTQFTSYRDIFYMWPIMGFCMLLPFGGYAVYFPELFPTRLRTTGTGLCYNVGRYVSASGPLLLGALTVALRDKTPMDSFRVAALIVSCCYLIGIVALIWAPETVNQPLPEEERGFAH